MSKHHDDDDDTATIDTRQIEVDLTAAEISARQATLCERLAELDRVKEERAKAGAKFGVLIKDLDSEIRGLREAARQGRELRTVEVRMRVEHGVAYFVRTDTGDTVDQRAATPAEMQRTLPHHGGPKGPAVAAAGSGPGGDLVERAKQAQRQGKAAPDPDEHGDVPADGDELAARRGKAAKKAKRKPKGDGGGGDGGGDA